MVDSFSFCLSDASNICTGQALKRSQAQEFISALPHKFRALISTAGLVSQDLKTFTCGVISAKSGLCSEDCAFCTQSHYHKTNTAVYNLVSQETLYNHANKLAKRGINRMGIVTGGGSPNTRDLEIICQAAQLIVKDVDIKLCASLGVLDKNQVTCLVQAGFTGYHHNLETGKSFYPNICTTHAYNVREQTVQLAQAAGLQVCSGGIFGIGESWEQRLELSEALQNLEVNSIPINFLVPIKGTPLEGANPLKAQECLAIIAIMRLMHPNKDIVICAGRSQCLGEWDRSIYFAGANGLMLGDFLTTKGSALDRDMEILSVLGFK